MPLGASRIAFLAKSATVIVEATVIRKKVGVSAQGSAQVDTAQSKFSGASGLFDGATSGLQPGNTLEWTNANGWTIEGWFRFLNTSTNEIIVDFRQDGNITRFPGLRNGRFAYYAGGWRVGSVRSANTWYHVAWVYDGTNVKMYVDGTLDLTYAEGGTFGDSRVSIGARYDIGSAWYDGHIDEMRFSNTARYTANFTAPTAPFVSDENTMLLLHMDGSDASTHFEDDNGVRAPIGVSANGNAQVDTAQYKFGGSSLQLDGSGDYALIQAQDAGWDLSGDFTIEFWFRFDAITDKDKLFDTRYNSNVGLGAAIVVDYDTANTKIRTFLDSGDRNTQSTALSTGTWYHYALVRSGSTAKFYINGTEEGSHSTSTDDYTPAYPWTIGANGDNQTQDMDGNIDEFRVSKTARYTSNFTPSTTPFVNDDDTLLLLHMDGTDGSTDFRDDVGTGRSAVGITAAGNAHTESTQSKFGGTSAQFDSSSSGDYLDMRGPLHDTAGGEFTFETWIYQTNNTTAQYAGIYMGDISVSSSRHKVYIGGPNAGAEANTIYLALGSGGSYSFLSQSYTFSTNTWYHLAISRDSSNDIRWFVNGTQVGSAINNSKDFFDTSSDARHYIGRYSNTSYPLRGYLDELRISNTARYTSNFTVPTEPFQNDADTLLLLHMDGTDGDTTFIDDNGKH